MVGLRGAVRPGDLDGVVRRAQGAVRRALGQLQRVEDDDRGAAPRRLLAGVLDELQARRLGPADRVRRVRGLVLDRVLDEGAAADAAVDALGAALLELLLLAAVPPPLQLLAPPRALDLLQFVDELAHAAP